MILTNSPGNHTQFYSFGNFSGFWSNKTPNLELTKHRFSWQAALYSSPVGWAKEQKKIPQSGGPRIPKNQNVLKTEKIIKNAKTQKRLEICQN